MSITSNCAQIHQNIRHALHAAGRDDEAISVICVSKTRTSEAIREALAAGMTDFGENYLQEALEKNA